MVILNTIWLDMAQDFGINNWLLISICINVGFELLQLVIISLCTKNIRVHHPKLWHPKLDGVRSCIILYVVNHGKPTMTLPFGDDSYNPFWNRGLFSEFQSKNVHLHFHNVLKLRPSPVSFRASRPRNVKKDSEAPSKRGWHRICLRKSPGRCPQ